MKKEFKITLEDGDRESDLYPYTQAQEIQSFLFEMNYNFWKGLERENESRWDKGIPELTAEEIKERYFELFNEYTITLQD